MRVLAAPDKLGRRVVLVTIRKVLLSRRTCADRCAQLRMPQRRACCILRPASGLAARPAHPDPPGHRNHGVRPDEHVDVRAPLAGPLLSGARDERLMCKRCRGLPPPTRRRLILHPAGERGGVRRGLRRAAAPRLHPAVEHGGRLAQNQVSVCCLSVTRGSHARREARSVAHSSR